MITEGRMNGFIDQTAGKRKKLMVNGIFQIQILQVEWFQVQQGPGSVEMR